MNLLQETLEVLSDRNKSPADVRWVGNFKSEAIAKPPFAFGSWGDFASYADFEYDDSSILIVVGFCGSEPSYSWRFGGVEISTNFKIVGDDWWLEMIYVRGGECAVSDSGRID